MEIKATTTLLPGHADALIHWSNLAGDLKAGSILVADVAEPFSIRGCRATPWKHAPDLI